DSKGGIRTNMAKTYSDATAPITKKIFKIHNPKRSHPRPRVRASGGQELSLRDVAEVVAIFFKLGEARISLARRDCFAALPPAMTVFLSRDSAPATRELIAAPADAAIRGFFESDFFRAFFPNHMHELYHKYGPSAK
ncbi:MAG: hypothetical protein FWG18_02200, partial [Alphaproteobacteria bacterium]|nr:hypothetical protein [Alphaproteobacteria bacterium]